MAKKEYNIKQERKFNNEVSKAYLSVTCEETEIQGFLDKLDGVLTVFEQNVSLSSVPEASNVVTGGLCVTSVSMAHDAAKTVSIYSSRPMLFKSTVSVAELQASLMLWKPFNGAYETETPTKVYPKIASIIDL